MNDFQHFVSLIRFMSAHHPYVLHSAENVHFANTLDSADNAYAHRMNYPCVCLDLGDMRLADDRNVERSIVLMFLDHVADTGSEQQRESAFERTCTIAVDFLAQLDRLSTKYSDDRDFRFLTCLDLPGTELVRVELEEAGLYGWLVSLNHRFSLNSILCETRWSDDFDEGVELLFRPSDNL